MVRPRCDVTCAIAVRPPRLKIARALQIEDRGAILPGYWADILIYDLDRFYFDTQRYEIVNDMPGGDWRRKGRAGGYDFIIVNGDITHERDEPTNNAPGLLVRVTQDAYGAPANAG